MGIYGFWRNLLKALKSSVSFRAVLFRMIHDVIMFVEEG